MGTLEAILPERRLVSGRRSLAQSRAQVKTWLAHVGVTNVGFARQNQIASSDSNNATQHVLKTN